MNKDVKYLKDLQEEVKKAKSSSELKDIMKTIVFCGIPIRGYRVYKEVRKLFTMIEDRTIELKESD